MKNKYQFSNILIFNLSNWACEESIIEANTSLVELFCEWKSSLIEREWFQELFTNSEWHEIKIFDAALSEAMGRHHYWPVNSKFFKYKKGKEIVALAKKLLEILEYNPDPEA